jgi:microcystin-dependent protein
MAEPFLAEIRLCSFNFPPKGWALCNGQLLPINQNQALFSLLGTTYGGDGRVNFALPDLRGKLPIHVGAGFALGQQGGEQNHTLTAGEANHTHSRSSADASTGFATEPNAGNHGVGTPVFETKAAKAFSPVANTNMASTSSDFTGGGLPHNNMMPSLTLNFVIALQGIFPSPN